ncbi:hypothetical protein [Taklimakanibacter deserti]|uniref:hypothetical protein n=1 Tax=Taklimakanibacter deserti TaxID=2267839 RepID=UPI0013C4F10E
MDVKEKSTRRYMQNHLECISQQHAVAIPADGSNTDSIITLSNKNKRRACPNRIPYGHLRTREDEQHRTDER